MLHEAREQIKSAYFVDAGLQAMLAIQLDGKRLARRLLMGRDRIGADELPLTQEFLGQNAGNTQVECERVGQRIAKAQD